MTDFTQNASGLLVPVEPPQPEPETPQTTEFVGPRLSPEEQYTRALTIGRNLLLSCLLKMDWSTCKPRSCGVVGIEPSRSFQEEVEEAAREMKAAGIGWEAWT